MLSIDLWPWKPFLQSPLTWWIFVPSFIKLTPLSTEISHHVKYWLTKEVRTAELYTRTHNAFRRLLLALQTLLHAKKISEARNDFWNGRRGVAWKLKSAWNRFLTLLATTLQIDRGEHCERWVQITSFQCLVWCYAINFTVFLATAMSARLSLAIASILLLTTAYS